MSKYTVRRLLYTRGDTVACYEAVQAGLDRRVELRVFTKQTAPDAAELVRFQAEVRSLSVLDHPGIVRVIDGGLSAGKLYYVAELKSGRPILELLREGFAFDPATVIEVGLQIAEAAAYMHSKGVLHRGIDVDSVYYDQERKIAYIGQFTLIRNTRVESITAKGIAPLSPWLTTPDAVIGRPADAQTDIYLLGVLLFRLLTGRAPFASDAFLSSTATALGRMEVPRPGAENPAVSADLDSVVMRAIAPQAEKRFRIVGDLVTALRNAQRAQRIGRRKGSGGGGADASRADLSRSSISMVGRSGMLDASAVGGGGAGSVTDSSSQGRAIRQAVVAPTPQPPPARPTPPASASAPVERKKLMILAGVAVTLLVVGLLLLRWAMS